MIRGMAALLAPLAFALLARPAAATVIRTPVRLQPVSGIGAATAPSALLSAPQAGAGLAPTLTPALGSTLLPSVPLRAAGASGTAGVENALPAVPLRAAGASGTAGVENALPAVALPAVWTGRPVFAEPAATLPPVLGSASRQADAASKDVAAVLGRDGGLSAFETLGRHFDGSRLAAPVAAPSMDDVLQALPDSVEFNGLRLPPAQFSEDGPGWMSSKLIAAIDATRDTLDLALLEVMHRDLFEAVARARARGVKVRIVIDSMHVYPEKPGQHRSAEIQALIDQGFDLGIVRGRDRFGLMHNKFAVLDGRLLWSGSANWSRAADTVHQENATYTADAHRIAGFQGVWQWMWDMGTPFGQPPGKADGRVPPQDPRRPVRFHGEGLPAYAFAPGDAAEAWLIKAISLAGRSLDIAMFSCTSERIKEALLEARSRGVKIRLVFDKAQFRFLPPMMWFVDNGFDVRLAEGFRPGRSAMHHKFVIFDGELLQNGSYNWTDGAKYNNFENVQFFDEPQLLAAYREAYGRLIGRSKPVGRDDLEANRAAADERAKEDPDAAKAGGRKLSRRLARPWDGRRFALSPFRRSALS
ncbi:MAG: hypothetical protein HY927_08090 [Elusimicrobia bacterium]|nr:hypothetical protein [Elusimicrobiota bacterium]